MVYGLWSMVEVSGLGGEVPRFRAQVQDSGLFGNMPESCSAL